MSSGTPRRDLHEARAAAALRPNVEAPAFTPAAPPPAIDGEEAGIVSSAIAKGSPAVPDPLPIGVDGCPAPPPAGVACLFLAFAAAACVTERDFKPATSNCQTGQHCLHLLCILGPLPLNVKYLGVRYCSDAIPSVLLQLLG